MKCHYCGAETNLAFCHHCGTRQQTDAQEQPKAAVEAKEFIWQPFQPGEQIAEIPVLPDFYYGEEKPAGVKLPSGSIPQPAQERSAAPRLRLPDGRSWVKMTLLGILTLGIYPAVIWSRMVTELNLAASRYDGERTMPFFAMSILSPFTLFIYLFVWFHDFSSRVGRELQRRQLDYSMGAKDFWLWNLLGCLILVGPFVYVHKVTKAMNLINADFNING